MFKAGFMGNYCELTLDVCVSNPCMNNGLCENRQGGMYRCVCSEGYTGLKCQHKRLKTLCDPCPCLNSGTCVVNGPSGFEWYVFKV